MNRTLNFFNRNLKEISRDPLMYVFCIGFPVVMLAIFQIINGYTDGNTPMFNLTALLPAIIMFSYTFVMLTMALIVSKDRQTFFLKRLYASPMKAYEFILGYSLVGLVIGLLQTLVCVLTGWIVSLITNANYISFGETLLLVVSEIPTLITSIFFGILFGTVFNDKTAPGICSIFISLAGVLGGCWMPIESMGGFETFARCLPFYPTVYLGRVITGATNVFNLTYTFDSVAKLGLIPILLFTLASVVLAVILFKKKMTSDN